MTRGRWTALALALLACALVVGVRLSPLGGDADASDYGIFYRPVAASLADGDGPYLDGEPAVRYPIGFPAVLAAARAATGADGRAVTLVNAASLAVAAVAAYALGRRWFTERVAVLAGLLVCVNPLVLYSAAAPSTELPFIALLMAGIVLVSSTVTWQRALAAGVLFGAATLVRPAGVLACLVAAGVLLALRTRATLAGLVVVGAIATIVPWGAWTAAHGPAAPLGTMGPLTATAGLTFAERDEVEGPVRGVPDDVRALGRRALAADTSSYGDIASFLGDEIRAHPLAVAELAAVKATRSWYGTDSFRREPMLALVQLAFLAIAVPGLYLIRANRPALVWVLAMTLTFWFTAITAVSIARYVLPAVPLLCLPAAVTLDRAWARLTRRA